jgi:ribosomal-protein-serine acetyltransferase
MILPISPTTHLELTAPQHAEGLFKAVDLNRVHLAEFLPWVGNMQSFLDFERYIAMCEQLYSEGREVSFVIIDNNEIVGRIGLHYINPQNKCAAIGYWLTKAAEGQGIITQSCRAIIDYGFNELGLHRIELKAATANTKSQAVPQRLGFTKEGILRDAELVNGHWHDLVLFSVLKEEWPLSISNAAQRN